MRRNPLVATMLICARLREQSSRERPDRPDRAGPGQRHGGGSQASAGLASPGGHGAHRGLEPSFEQADDPAPRTIIGRG